MAIPKLAEIVWPMLKPLPADDSNQHSPRSEMRSLIRRLPAELQDLIFKEFHPWRNPPLACTRLVDPINWRALFKDLLPWLWDLDLNEVPKRPASISSQEWDWELLIRQLAQSGAFDRFPRLRNRQRIWHLLEDMRVGDFDYPSKNAETALWG